MTANEFKPGDQIILKSGGPTMTVESVQSDGRGLWAQWFAGKKLERGHFSLASIEAAPEENGE